MTVLFQPFNRRLQSVVRKLPRNVPRQNPLVRQLVQPPRPISALARKGFLTRAWIEAKAIADGGQQIVGYSAPAIRSRS
jgi:hypothetical protein